ncbi:unnamed protein product [Rotaria magnacalcarata]|uniref:Thyroid transcription factor 1-associated protein 26 n=1 Tax=Rotaria magnacalcarata TaxID=392030 RepID=A0A816X133_9BILA|nr:unnamed protein product [Rotaria magnacalcarata]CAF1632552.1 unnamed protein product [Rotaria magnacalcarata]CAF2027843.1 unnamed protein product [Rotaria magnacalcarata]CAF2070549.1 unnamed protein product [Rotaria magnacalcarata]CAF2140525.1 unnamed protein product [Rotaria magnacalcarata]
MKKDNIKVFQENKNRKSHNQKIRDAHILREQEKEAAKQAKEIHQQDASAAIARYKRNKQFRLKKLTKKTRRGQPVMQGQIELLLDKIQQQKQNEKQ